MKQIKQANDPLTLKILDQEKPVFAIAFTTSLKVESQRRDGAIACQDIQFNWLEKFADGEYYVVRHTWQDVSNDTLARIFRIASRYFRDVEVKDLESNPEYWNSSVWLYSRERSQIESEARAGNKKAIKLLECFSNRSW